MVKHICATCERNRRCNRLDRTRGTPCKDYQKRQGATRKQEDRHVKSK